MSRTAAKYNMVWTRGATVEDEFTYTDSAGAPINLTGYSARMHVRTADDAYGTSATPLLSLTTANGLLIWATATAGRLTLVAPPTTIAVLNPTNSRAERYAYSIELYLPSTPEYVLPLIEGKITVKGEITR